MKIFPTKAWAILRLALLCGLLLTVAGYFRIDRVVAYHMSDLQVGDIVFQSLPRGPLVNTIEGVSESEWSHCGILVWKNEQWMVAEALGEVRYTPLTQWVLRGRWSRVASFRLKKVPTGLSARLASALESYMGRPYDFHYAPDDEFMYCSELVEKVYKRTFGQKLGTWQALGDLNWEPHEAFIREVELGELPLTRLMVTPVSLTRSANLKQVS